MAVNPLWKIVGWAGGVLGAVATGAAIGAAAGRLSTVRSARMADGLDQRPFDELISRRESIVAADDGVPLVVEEINPADGALADVHMVFVHGYALDRRSWIYQKEVLTRPVNPRIRQIFYDQRSHGQSGRSSSSTSTIEQLGRDLDAVLRALVPQGPIVLVGHSMGGMTIMALAEQRPELFAQRVRGVALIGTAAGAVGGAGLPKSVLSRYNPVTLGLAKLVGLQPDFVEWARRRTTGLTWTGIKNSAFGSRKIDPDLVDLVHSMISGTSVAALADFLQTLGTHNRYLALAGLQYCEVMVLSGDADRITPFSHAERMAKEMPHGELIRVAGGGHMLMMEQPDLINKNLIELARRSVRRDRDK